jgi:hypothetical protein
MRDASASQRKRGELDQWPIQARFWLGWGRAYITDNGSVGHEESRIEEQIVNSSVIEGAALPYLIFRTSELSLGEFMIA